MDDERLSDPAGDLDVGPKGAMLIGARGAVAVVVEPRLPHRRHPRIGGELLDPRRGRVVEARRSVGMAPDTGVDLGVLLGGRDRLLAPRLVDSDAEHPPDADPARVGDQLGGGGLHKTEMAVGVDHGSGSVTG